MCHLLRLRALRGPASPNFICPHPHLDGLQKMEALECEHAFCLNCWRGYLNQKVMEEGVSISIACPAADCALAVGDDVVMRLLEDAVVKRRYTKLITNSFVEVFSLHEIALLSAWGV